MDIRASLVSRVERYIKRLGISDTAFGEAAAQDGHFLRRLRAGKDIRVTKLERVQRFLRDNPHGLPAKARAA